MWGYVDEAPSWRKPDILPDLTGHKVIAIDVETYDPLLQTHGPSHVFGQGYLVGVSVATDEEHKWYIPVRTEHVPHGFDEAQVLEWVASFATRDALLVGANLMYDIGWLNSKHTVVEAKLYDVQFAEALLDEHRRSYALEAIADNYGLEGKASNELYEWCAAQFGGRADERQRANIYRAPLHLVGPYAERDATLPIAIREKQMPLIEEQGLSDVLDMEHGLIPMLIAMRKRGVRVDMEARDRLADRLTRELTQAKATVLSVAGKQVNVNSAKEIAAVFDANDWEYEVTDKGNPSFTKAFLAQSDNPFAKAVGDVRLLEKMYTTFVEGYFSLAHNGRIHSSLHPLRTGNNGTVSGRFACSSPNTQNIPARHPVYGPLIRGLFIPEEGEYWASHDLSQIELRCLAHYAVGPGADEVRRQYNEDRDTDFHQLVIDKTGLPRKPAKTVSFSLCYGSGVANTAELLGCTLDEAKAFRDQHFAGMPFMKATFDEAMHRASTRGWIRTIMGRLARFNEWEPADFEIAKELGTFDDRDQCVKMVRRYMQDIMNIELGPRVSAERLVKRARTYKALNALLQGSAADLMKMAMLKIWHSGVCDVLGAPLSTVHDELNWSVPRTKEAREALTEAKHIMETAIPLRVPVLSNEETGPDWGHLEET